MQTRPTPTGWQHYLDVKLRRAPDTRFTDPIRALADLETGLAQPVVEIVEQHEGGGATVQVSVFGDNPESDNEETAACSGLVAELRYADVT